MTRGELARIFEAFSQGDHALQSGPHRFGGIGLGLAISQVMVKRHQGSISASSPGRNQGTTFLVKLPLIRRILLVEDHQPTSNALARLLARRTHRVVAAACVAEARAAADHEDFDILISDIGLPDGNGYELMTELGNRHGLVGIALSGYGMEMDVSRSRTAGFVTHLIKPVSVETLDRALAEARRSTGGG